MDMTWINGAQTLAMTWAPRLVAALLILIIAHFIAKGVKWGIAAAINRIPALKNVGGDTGAQIGEVGYWLVWMVGLVAALNPLGLSSVVAPLQTLTNQVFGYIPNLIGAGLIFFIGSLVARVARQLVEASLKAANADAWAERAGLSAVTGTGGASAALGVVVYAVVIVPVAIAALQALKISAISDPAVSILQSMMGALPRVISASILLAIAFFIARWIAGLIEQVLPSTGLDKAVQSLGLLTGDMTASKVAGNIALAAIMIFAAVEATKLLEFSAASDMLREVIGLGSRVLFGGAIIAATVALANMLATVIGKASGESAGFAPRIVRYATIAIGTAMGLRFMGLANDIITLAFGLTLGSAAVACALAFGMGGREAAAKFLARFIK
jgi:hypothetical protein